MNFKRLAVLVCATARARGVHNSTAARGYCRKDSALYILQVTSSPISLDGRTPYFSRRRGRREIQPSSGIKFSIGVMMDSTTPTQERNTPGASRRASNLPNASSNQARLSAGENGMRQTPFQ